MSSRSLSTVFTPVVVIALLGNAGSGHAQPVFAVGEEAEITSDGLHKLDPSIMGVAWVHPDLDLSQYDEVYFMPTAVHFREVREKNYTIRTMESEYEFPITEDRKAQLTRLFEESVRDALPGPAPYEVSDKPGPRVLLVQGILTDVISGVPPDVPGSSIQNIRWAWEANILLEVRDAMSYEVLARTVERQRMDGPFFTGMVWALTPTIVDRWSRLIMRRLAELTALYPSRISRRAAEAEAAGPPSPSEQDSE